MEIADIIKKLDLKHHPEGGYFKETYRSSVEIPSRNLPQDYTTSRNFSTCIYFLLTSEEFSAFHKIKQDEIWHFYQGAPIRLHTISPDGKHMEHLIGNDLTANQLPQLIVKGGSWFAAEVTKAKSYSLVGCTVSPGFSFEDFELANRDQLVSNFPHLQNLIVQFSRKQKEE